ncbi:hypothetical protein [Zoogloea sp.]|uniref:hypothetical protein n=1 Tax=Zoogloea sp. TaxID=49181 RepID=UPI001415EC96|nr:MAG: hypothetical protein F9K15_22050 [Zoogloea sp.]
MRKKVIASIFGAALFVISGATSAQLGGLLGGNKGAESTVTAESLVKSYVTGTQQVMNAKSSMLTALGLKEAAEKEALAAKNLTQGATTENLEDVAKIQTESSKALTDAMAAKKGKLTADSKKTYAIGLIEMVKGLKSYAGMSGDVKNFKPGITSIGGAAGAATHVVKTLPDNISNTKATLQSAINFAKENKIEVPADATSLL